MQSNLGKTKILHSGARHNLVIPDSGSMSVMSSVQKLRIRLLCIENIISHVFLLQRVFDPIFYDIGLHEEAIWTLMSRHFNFF